MGERMAMMYPAKWSQKYLCFRPATVSLPARDTAQLAGMHKKQGLKYKTNNVVSDYETNPTWGREMYFVLPLKPDDVVCLNYTGVLQLWRDFDATAEVTLHWYSWWFCHRAASVCAMDTHVLKGKENNVIACLRRILLCTRSAWGEPECCPQQIWKETQGAALSTWAAGTHSLIHSLTHRKRDFNFI